MDLSSIDPTLLTLTNKWIMGVSWGAGLIAVALFFRISGSSPADIIRAIRGKNDK